MSRRRDRSPAGPGGAIVLDTTPVGPLSRSEALHLLGAAGTAQLSPPSGAASLTVDVSVAATGILELHVSGEDCSIVGGRVVRLTATGVGNDGSRWTVVVVGVVSAPAPWPGWAVMTATLVTGERSR